MSQPESQPEELRDTGIEVIETRAAGWAWRCHRCDITKASLSEDEALGQAREHALDSIHRRARW